MTDPGPSPLSSSTDLFLRPNQSHLFVGEGNFSFSLTILEKYLGQKQDQSLPCHLDLTSTCFESDPVSPLAGSHAERLQQLGAQVKFGVDATQLERHFASERLDRIVFMFPHVGGKMKIGRNRLLLQQFARSCTHVAKCREARVVVALCRGQGGTAYDGERRRDKANSWQVTDMMAHGGWQLTRVGEFDFEQFPDYAPFGYRSLNKGFHVEKAVVHEFQLNPFPPIAEFSADKYFLCGKMRQLEGGDSKVGRLVRRFKDEIKAEFGYLADLGACLEGESADAADISADVCFVRTRLSFKVPPAKCFALNPLSISVDVRVKPDDRTKLEAKIREWDFATTSTNRLTSIDMDQHLKENISCAHWREMWSDKVSLDPSVFSHDLSFWVAGLTDSCLPASDSSQLEQTCSNLYNITISEDSPLSRLQCRPGSDSSHNPGLDSSHNPGPDSSQNTAAALSRNLGANLSQVKDHPGPNMPQSQNPPLPQPDSDSFRNKPDFLGFESRLLDLLWRLAGDFVLSFRWLDTSYVNAQDGRRSCTARIEYGASVCAMSPDDAWILHSDVIGGQMARALSLEIR